MIRPMWKQEGVHLLQTVAIGVMIAICFRTFFFSTYVVEGKSMLPTLQDGNMIVINKLGYQVGDLHRFDVVVFHANKEEDYVKRIIGLPGDTIEYRHDTLYVNGQPIDEPYLEGFKKQLIGQQLTGNFTLEEVTGRVKVPNDSVFLLGDNRTKSWDSRNFGFVKMKQIVGTVDLRYWPLDELTVRL